MNNFRNIIDGLAAAYLFYLAFSLSPPPAFSGLIGGWLTGVVIVCVYFQWKERNK